MATTQDRRSSGALKRGVLITARQVEQASIEAKTRGLDVWLSDPAPRGAGRLAVRCRPNGARLLMFRHTLADGTRDAMPLGVYDSTGLAGLDLSEARARVGELARLRQSGVDDLRAHFAAQAEAQRAAEAERRTLAERGSLAALCDAYAGTLKGRASHGDVRRQLALHVTEAFPELAAQPAATIKAEQFRDVLARLIEAGKGRTAAKVRSYLRSAYSVAMRAGLDPSVPGEFGAFRVEANPLERLPSLAQFNRARDRALTQPELVAFWRRVKAAREGVRRDAVVALLLLGGQRAAQLLRATRADVDLTALTITLRDPKGRNRAANPRRHVLPLVDDLTPVIARRLRLCATADSPLFTATGTVPLREETAAELVTTVCANMAKAGELERGPFTLGDLRRTCETHLAALGVSREVRAQIQSHGLGGVQQRHYDRHDYASEKLAALELFARRLAGTEAPKVAALPRRRKVAR